MKFFIEKNNTGCSFVRGSVSCCDKMSALFFDGKIRVSVFNEVKESVFGKSGVVSRIGTFIDEIEISCCPACGKKIEYIIPEDDNVSSKQSA